MEETEQTYRFEDLISVVKRENNTKRSFLFMNRMQAKYLPSDPEETLTLFGALGKKAAVRALPGPVVVIGFAETATAIGAAVAACVGGNCFYLHSTRERLADRDFQLCFGEEHSHATRHFLYCRDRRRLQEAGTIIFVDDEFTTGKTICNLTDALTARRLLRPDVRILALSLINCMASEHLRRFDRRGISWDCLVRHTADWSRIRWEGHPRADVTGREPVGDWKQYCTKGYEEIRCGMEIGVYLKKCKKLYEFVETEQLVKADTRNLLLLGTEEFMYPVILAGAWLKQSRPGMQVRVHALSRSPILSLDSRQYAVKNRSRIPSLYDVGRQVYLYNLDRYDQVILFTDAAVPDPAAEQACVSVLEQFGNRQIALVRWCQGECVL